ncbi:MAG: hypothetical protein ACFE8C_13355 [Promethearchaeota archaeon]
MKFKKKNKKKKRKIIIIGDSLHRLTWDNDRKEYNHLAWYVEHIRRLYDFENKFNV